MPPVINLAGNLAGNLASTTLNRVSIAVWLLFALPVILGLIGIILPAFGFFPAMGKTSFSLDAARQFISTPGLSTASWLSLKTGLLATALSLFGSFILMASLTGTRAMSWLGRLMGPLVAIPHSTIAIGMVFLLTPSGWLMRLVSPWLTGFDRPPANLTWGHTWGLVPDPDGMALVVGLMAKEIPFLLLVGLVAAQTLPLARMMNVGFSLGYGRLTCWAFIIFPMIYRQLRLPVMAVLVFSLSVVDMALLLAPSLPPPLAVLVLNGFNDADLAARLPASFGALVQIGLCLSGVAIWWIGEIIVGAIIGAWRQRGFRAAGADIFLKGCAGAFLLPLLLGILGLVAAAIWSCASSWFFPAALPASTTILHWQAAADYWPLISNSWYLAILSSGAAVVIVFLWLYQARNRAQDHPNKPPRHSRFIISAIYLPLLVPQISFMFGLQIGLSWAELDGTWSALIFSHMIFIMPYAWLVIAPAFAAMEWRHDHLAASLGLSPFQRFLRVHLPLLAPALGMALFIGICVSIALYLPTVFVGGGRISTITVEAISLAANGGRGPAGVAAMLQILIPLAGFIVIRTALSYRFAKFSGMCGGLR